MPLRLTAWQPAARSAAWWPIYPRGGWCVPRTRGFRARTPAWLSPRR